MRGGQQDQAPDLLAYHTRRMAGELPSGALGLPRLPFRPADQAAGPRAEVPQAVPFAWRPRWTAVPPKPRRPS